MNSASCPVAAIEFRKLPHNSPQIPQAANVGFSAFKSKQECKFTEVCATHIPTHVPPSCTCFGTSRIASITFRPLRIVFGTFPHRLGTILNHLKQILTTNELLLFT